MAVARTATIASSSARMNGSGKSPKITEPGPSRTTAFIVDRLARNRRASETAVCTGGRYRRGRVVGGLVPHPGWGTRRRPFRPGPQASAMRHAAVGDDQLPGHPAGLLRGEEGDGGCDVGRLAAPWDALQHLDELERLGVRAGQDTLRGGQAGSDRVHRHALLAELPGERAREGEDATLRGDVVREVGRPGEDDVRGDVDDAAVACLPHRLGRVPAGEEDAVEVDRHDPAPLGEVDLVPGLEGDDRRVVDE